ncbi:MAG: hypothetical protein KGZ75_03200 [Syntrophomonadaceae bacterium]|nr:hypothetical protein [Syntrophomonadaceae bacterium]
MMWIIWPAIALLVWLAAYYFVSRDNIKKFFPLGLAGGLALSFGIQLVGSTFLDLWRFAPVFPSIAGIPLFLPVAYTALVILFAQYLPGGAGERAFYVSAFAGLLLLIDWGLLFLGLVTFTGWDLLFTFFLGLAYFGLVVVLYRVMHAGRIAAGGR